MNQRKISKRLGAFLATCGVAWLPAVVETAGIEPSVLDQLRLDMAKRWHFQPGAPFPPYALTNLSADVRRVRARIEDLKKARWYLDREIQKREKERAEKSA